MGEENTYWDELARDMETGNYTVSPESTLTGEAAAAQGTAMLRAAFGTDDLEQILEMRRGGPGKSSPEGAPMSFTVNASILLTDLPLTERPAAVAAQGFTRAEFWWPFASPVPEHEEADAFVAALQDAGVQLTGLNFYAGDMPAGERGVLSQPARTAEFRANVAAVVEIARETGCRAFNALYGNRVADVPDAEQDAAAVENLRWAADAVAPFGGVVLLEPISGIPDHPLRTAADALAVIRAVGRENVKLLADFYHLAVNGEDVAAVVEDHAAQFGHVQIADAPGRHEPGTGGLPLGRWIRRARELGYEGLVGLEYTQSAEDPFAWLPREQRP